MDLLPQARSILFIHLNASYDNLIISTLKDSVLQGAFLNGVSEVGISEYNSSFVDYQFNKRSALSLRHALQQIALNSGSKPFHIMIHLPQLHAEHINELSYDIEYSQKKCLSLANIVDELRQTIWSHMSYLSFLLPSRQPSNALDMGMRGDSLYFSSYGFRYDSWLKNKGMGIFYLENPESFTELFFSLLTPENYDIGRWYQQVKKRHKYGWDLKPLKITLE